SVVADGLAALTREPATRAGLAEASQALRPGLPRHSVPPPGAERWPLPEQYAAYQPAWAIASSVLAQRQLAPPSHHLPGFGFTLAGSSLLEDLLTASLVSAGRIAKQQGHAWSHRRQSPRLLLVPVAGPGIEGHRVIPDDVVFVDGKPAAVFDAKYK